MLYIAQNAAGKWVIANRNTRKVVRNPNGPGLAVYETKEEAERNIEAAQMAVERESW